MFEYCNHGCASSVSPGVSSFPSSLGGRGGGLPLSQLQEDLLQAGLLQAQLQQGLPLAAKAWKTALETW